MSNGGIWNIGRREYWNNEVEIKHQTLNTE
jgi:hypothetical protein